MNLHRYDMVIINSSAGKDSLVAIYAICKMADEQGYDKNKISISHQDLARIEWPGTKELVNKQAEFFGLRWYFSKRRDKNGYEETLLEYVERRGMWPDNVNRWCTSDFKRGPGGRVVTKLTKGAGNIKVLYVFGFRAEESPSRKKKSVLTANKDLTTIKRKVYNYLPIHKYSTDKVWEIIRTNKLPYHYAYDLGMPRLSCCFCIFSPFDALVIAGRANPELLDEYIAVETKIGHLFRHNFSLQEVKKAILNNYQPLSVPNWVM